MRHVLRHLETVFIDLTTGGVNYTLAVEIDHASTPVFAECFPIDHNFEDIREDTATRPQRPSMTEYLSLGMPVPVFTRQQRSPLYPRKVMADIDVMKAMPPTLIALVQYANQQSGMPPDATTRALESIEECMDEPIGLVYGSTDRPPAE